MLGIKVGPGIFCFGVRLGGVKLDLTRLLSSTFLPFLVWGFPH